MVEGGRFWLDEATVARLGIEPGTLERRLARTSAQVREYLRRYRAGRPLPDVRGRTVLLVDDGLATGVTARAALRYLREERGAGRVLLAVPVGSPATLAELARDFDGLVCLRAPADFRSVGQAYEDFAPVADDEVRALLGRRPRHPPGPPAR
jgi:putative phosphoribosyl transferase